MSKKSPSGPAAALPESPKIGEYYDAQMREIGGDYIHRRWGDSEIKRRHYQQTRTTLLNVLDGVPSMADTLEVGAGPGVWTELYIPRTRRLQLLDVSEEMLASARGRIGQWDEGKYAARVSYRCGDAVASDLGSDRFDAIVSMRAFEYLSDKARFLGRCHDALRPGGRLVLGTKNDRWRDMDIERRQERRRTAGRSFEEAMQSDLVDPPGLVTLLQDAGLTVHGVFPLVFGSYYGPFHTGLGLAFCDFLHRRRFRRAVEGITVPLVESFVAVAEKRPITG